ncbi:DUF2871 domain-containing protein [Anaerofustis stercorihominis]|uniref:DUF2871 domain-containing protein n=2 Tax=Anaerofustis stercorihominis TaxID=214853 RepID=B1C892_9FIRM|nr:DUF2871 domain-containing protein [Anaerofustis stercorihominis]EDS73229.1 hypothetical protein ANASTE_00949 [Anaerofustis stercorihominis DSM 17244]MCQ4794526.1 DUF2871 domain-containing protein [Anaerofustis stercorihominis]RGD74163.1 DUF2871 domain-containing protein [Anaerofustis stercorihominis]
MKRLLNTSFMYAILAMIGGVFYREFTKYNGFTGVTMLSKVHAHLFMLGMIVFLVILLLNDKFDIISLGKFNIFYIIYNLGVLITSVMLAVHGVIQVLNVNISKALVSAISGIAGIGHIFVGVGILLLFFMLKERISEKE